MSVSDKWASLVGLPYIDGLQDCYGLVRRYYEISYSVSLTNYARPVFFWRNGLNFIDDCFEDQGFDTLVGREKPRIGDLFCMNVTFPTANHLAIYVGEGQILHHLYGRFSTLDPYDWKWKNRTLRTIRRRDLPAQELPAKPISLFEVSKARVMQNEDVRRRIAEVLRSKT